MSSAEFAEQLAFDAIEAKSQLEQQAAVERAEAEQAKRTGA